MQPAVRPLPLAGTVGDAARSLALRLMSAGIATAALDARLLVTHACELSRERFIIERARPVTPHHQARIDEYATRRLAGEPVSRILGVREFWGMTFKLSPDVLDPRPDTELVVETVLNHIRARGQDKAALRLLDLGVGSGCILAALLSELPNSYGVGVDCSMAACSVARSNLSRHGLIHRASVLCSDWASALAVTSFDVVVSNPPYIASTAIQSLNPVVRLFDPRIALDGGSEGLHAYRVILSQIGNRLQSDVFLVFETGYDNAKEVAALFRAGKWQTHILYDLAGNQRAVAAQRHSES